MEKAKDMRGREARARVMETQQDAARRLKEEGVILLGLTGRRHQGKSTVADWLVKEYGFVKAHAFDGGKKMTVTYFEYITGSAKIANAMVYGDLKDKPSEWLPGNASPRDFMERFGEFMGVQMGTAWTLEMEVSRLRRMGFKKIVVESLIYEADVFKGMGGYIVRCTRTDYDSPDVASDAVQALIKEDHAMTAGHLWELRSFFEAFMFWRYNLHPVAKPWRLWLSKALGWFKK